MNKIIVIGNLGRDPEMRYTPEGNGVTSFSVASNRKYTTAAGEQREETEWFDVNAWGKLGELCNQYLTKGQQVYLEGRLQSRTWETQDGGRRFTNSINVTECISSVDHRIPSKRAPRNLSLRRSLTCPSR